MMQWGRSHLGRGSDQHLLGTSLQHNGYSLWVRWLDMNAWGACRENMQSQGCTCTTAPHTVLQRLAAGADLTHRKRGALHLQPISTPPVGAGTEADAALPTVSVWPEADNQKHKQQAGVKLAYLQMLARALRVDEHSSTLNHQVNAQLPPGQLGGVAAGHHSDLLAIDAQGGVVHLLQGRGKQRVRTHPA